MTESSGPIEPLRYQSKSNAVYEELRRKILDGSLPPSTAVNQEQLAAGLGVSTTPLREALRRLESDGLVSSLAHREVMISALDFNELLAIYEVREDLDALAAALAAERHTHSDAVEIRAAARQLRRASQHDQLGVNRAYHASIYRASHNPVLIELLESLWDRSDRYRRAVGFLASEGSVMREHRELAKAVLQHRADDAAALMRAHIRRTRSTFEDRYGHDGPPEFAG